MGIGPTLLLGADFTDPLRDLPRTTLVSGVGVEPTDIQDMSLTRHRFFIPARVLLRSPSRNRTSGFRGQNPNGNASIPTGIRAFYGNRTRDFFYTKEACYHSTKKAMAPAGGINPPTLVLETNVISFH